MFADADLDAAAAKAAGQYDDAGQVCLAGTRLLVEAVGRATSSWSVPTRRRRARARRPARRRDHDLAADPPRPPGAGRGLRRARARADGDGSLRGGQAAERGGLFYEPTLIEPRVQRLRGRAARGVRAGADACRRSRDEEEAIELANSTEYGLSGIVYTGSRPRRARRPRACAPGRRGSTRSSSATSRRRSAAWGSRGIGREGGDYALDFYSDLKTLQILDGLRRDDRRRGPRRAVAAEADWMEDLLVRARRGADRARRRGAPGRR